MPLMMRKLQQMSIFKTIMLIIIRLSQVVAPVLLNARMAFLIQWDLKYRLVVVKLVACVLKQRALLQITEWDGILTVTVHG